MAILRTKSKDGGEGKPINIDEERLLALLGNPEVEKQLQAERTRLLSERHRHADEVSKLEADLLRRLPEYDARLAALRDQIDKIEKQRFELRERYCELDYEKSVFFHHSMHSKRVHENELNISAPLVDEFISEIIDLWERNQNVAPSEAVLSSKIDMTGQTKRVTVETDAPAANSWQIQMGNVISAARAMKLEPDFRTFPERLAKLRELIADPRNFKKITISREIALPATNLRPQDLKGR